MKFINAFGALFFFSLGIIGVILPILPTTPFILLASYLAMRSSKRLDTMIKSTKIYQNHALPFIARNGLTLQTKLSILSFASFMLMFPLFILQHWALRLLIIILIITKYTYFFLFIKTIPNIQNPRNNNI